MVHEIPSSRKIATSRLFIVLTIIFWIMYATSVILRQLIEGPQSYQFTIEAYFYLTVVTFLTFSALMYLVARQGALQRFSKHVRVPRAVLDSHFADQNTSITVLVPSYSEEPNVVRMTLISAALQEFPNLRVVLLIDDDRSRLTEQNSGKFFETVALIDEINTLLKQPYEHVQKEFIKFEKANRRRKYLPTEDIKKISQQYEWASNWLKKFADNETIEDHVDVFFTEHMVRTLAKDLELVSKALALSSKEGTVFTVKRGMELYNRLLNIFNVEVDMFERKRYACLSKEANKAMNLNSYIGLMGGMYIQEDTPDGIILIETDDRNKADLIVPDSEFLLTLDADSVLLPEYCLRLVYLLQQPNNLDVGVTQTPYSSFRGAPTRIERLAGGTTDVQHILHQGMCYYGAAFWVGANAVIRKKALEDIVETEWVGGYEIKRYVQDRTVIEDTESSIDLAAKGWRLVNYPERLSYSATPPDFGSLVVQRRRWANGGLLINPKLFAYAKDRKNKGNPVSKLEIMLRLNYMASIAWSNFGLVFLLAYPYDGRLLSPLVLLSAIPYFTAMASDLKYCRYKYTDIFRIYGFNLILLPVNLAGVIKSLQQALTTKKIPFARTPKVKDRTAAGLLFLISPIFIILFSLYTFWRNVNLQTWGNAAFAAFNALTATWAILTYIGLKNMIEDIWLGFTNMLYVESKPKKVREKRHDKREVNWKAVLYHGESEGNVPHGSVTDLILNNKGGNNGKR